MSNREPWLATILSTFLPGLGQIYARKRAKGLLLIFIYFSLQAIAFWQIFSSAGNTLIGLSFFPLILILLIWNLFDAFGSAKSNNSIDFEDLRKSTKDPWLAMFLSRIFFGIGHFYIGKWLFGIFAVILTIICSIASPLLAAIVSPYIAYLAYTFTPNPRERSKNLAFAIALIMVTLNLSSLGLAFTIRNYIVEARWIPSGSMEPTLHGSPNLWEADRVFVDKLNYRFQVPQRGDIVVFSPTKQLILEGYNSDFIHRVIGLPKEKVELKDGTIYINNKPLNEDNYLSPSQRTSADVCPSGLQPPFLSKPQTIPPNSYLVLGDNRRSSYDSRCWGFVERSNIIGKAYKIFFPFDRARSIDLQ